MAKQLKTRENAPGGPGIEPRWTSSAKSGVGTALSTTSHVWFTISHGILDEIYYPRVDLACTRDMGLIVTDGQAFFSEEKRHTRSHVEYLAKGAPAYRLTNICTQGRYRIEKEVIADPARDVVLQRTRFVPLQGSLADYHLYVILAPHLGNGGAGNTGWVGDYKGAPMLFAEREGNAALALASSLPWLQRSAGFVGSSDGWQDLSRHRRMTWSYTRAENGNVALTGEIDLQANDGAFVLAIGFDSHALSAGHHARASLLDGFDTALEQYIKDWQEWQSTLLLLEGVDEGPGARSQEPGARSQEPGARSQEPGARSQGPGARSQEPGARSQETRRPGDGRAETGEQRRESRDGRAGDGRAETAEQRRETGE